MWRPQDATDPNVTKEPAEIHLEIIEYVNCESLHILQTSRL